MFEHSTFSSKPNWTSASGPAEIVVLDSDQWPLIQPGIHDAQGGFRSHRVRRQFRADGRTAGLLGLVFFVDRGPCPDLLVELDGAHLGIVHPSVVRVDRTRTGQPGPIAGEAEVSLLFPAKWLTEGDHELVVSTVFDEGSALGGAQLISGAPSEPLPSARTTYGSWFGNYIRWSRASLTPAADSSPQTELLVRTTPFYLIGDDGEETLVECLLGIDPGATAPAALSLELEGRSFPLPVPADSGDFGHVRWRTAVPTFDGDVQARIRVDGTVGCEATLTAARRWTMHLIPHVHLDLGFTDSQGKVLELHCRNIDRALDLFDSDPSFRFSVDGAVIAREFERTRSAAQIKRMHAAIRSGQLGVNSFHSNMLTGLTTLDELIHSTDYARDSLPASEVTGHRYANITDIPVYSSTVPSALAAVGITRFVGMSNHHRGGTDTSDIPHLMSPMMWEGPDGAQVLAHFADHYSQLRFMVADPQTITGATDSLQRLTDRYERDDYAPHDLAVIGSHADNEDLADGDYQFAKRWNSVFSYPHFHISTFDEYLDSVAGIQDRLPVWRAESGTFWEDGAGSAAHVYGTYRRAQAQLPAVETLGAALSLRDSKYRVNRHELDRAWDDLAVAAEHTLTWARATNHPHAEPSSDQLAWKTRYIDDAARVGIDEQRRQLSRLAEIEGLRGPGLLVYNPHAWTADLQIEFDLAVGVDILDADGPISFEVLENCAGMQRCRLASRSVPPHSYRFLPASAELHTVPAGEAPDIDSVASDPAQSGAADETFIKRIAIESESGWEFDLVDGLGLLQSLKWKGRELLSSSPHRLGQLIRTVSADVNHRAVPLKDLAPRHDHTRQLIDSIDDRYSSESLSAVDLQHPAMHFVDECRVFDGTRLTFSGGGSSMNDISMVLLLQDTGRAQLDVSFDKLPELDMEAVYVSFPFAATDPLIRYDRPLGWVQPVRDHGPGASNEWMTLSTALIITDGPEGPGITWTSRDSALFAVGDVVRGAMPSTFPGASGQILGFLMNNFWPCNTPAIQNGRVSFRFAFTAIDRFDPAAAKRFGAEERISAGAVHMLALDRFTPDEEARFRQGAVIFFEEDRSIDRHIEECADGTFLMTTTNLLATPQSISIVLPDRTAEAIDLPGSGFARTRFRRGEFSAR